MIRRTRSNWTHRPKTGHTTVKIRRVPRQKVYYVRSRGHGHHLLNTVLQRDHYFDICGVQKQKHMYRIPPARLRTHAKYSSSLVGHHTRRNSGWISTPFRVIARHDCSHLNEICATVDCFRSLVWRHTLHPNICPKTDDSAFGTVARRHIICIFLQTTHPCTSFLSQTYASSSSQFWSL